MIVVFVVDTSPSMAEPANSANAADNPTKARGISRLDVAKMSVESMARSMDKRIVEHNRSVVMASAQAAASSGPGNSNIEVGRLEQFDEFLLLSTSLQPDFPSSSLGVPSAEAIAAAAEAHVACGAGGRLLVGCVESLDDKQNMPSTADGTGSGTGIVSSGGMLPHPPDRADFERELKRLRSAIIPTQKHNNNSEKNTTSFPDWAGGAVGLNAALSHGLGLLSRYRLTRGRIVEHFGMGRLPWFEHLMTKLTKEVVGDDPNANNANRNESPLQPACLVLLTDGECLRLPPEKGGGGLRLQFGNIPLREFYREPFRWDQRIFILHIGDSSTPLLHQSLRALCEVTGGAYMKINPSESSLTNILSRISPPRPKSGSIPDPLRLPSMPPQPNDTTTTQIISSSNIFANGGPVCGFQSMDCVGGDSNPSLHRAMIMFAGSCEQTRWILTAANAQQHPVSTIVQTPIWCIPEPYFPNKKLDTLPPRPSQPLLHYTRTYQAVGSPVFDPLFVMKALRHLDQLQVSIRQLIIDAGENPPPITNRMLQRDVYICDWLGGQESASKNNPPGVSANATGAPRIQPGREHFPVCVRGAGRPTISGEGGDYILNIGILHVPHDWIRMKDFVSNTSKSATPVSNRLSTLTLLPPDPHILIPLLIRVAEMELRVLKKATDSNKDKAGSRGGATAGLIKKKVNSAAAAKAIHLDDNWKSDFRAYIFRLPPYYHAAIRKVLRPMLPPNVLSLLPDNQEPLPSLCFSRACLTKIKNGEQLARDGNDWLRGVERDLRQRKLTSIHDVPVASAVVKPYTRSTGGGLIDPHSESSKSRYGQFDPKCMTEHSYKESLRSLPPPRSDKSDSKGENSTLSPCSVLDILNDLPSSCLLPYYESRRRWIFGGGTSLTTRGLHVDGVNNDGVNAQHFSSNGKVDDEPLIALAGVGADTMNQKKISEMGDFKERLAFNRVPLVGYGGSNASGSAVTTAADGSPTFTVDDEVFPLNFFDPKTGEFIDNSQIRAKARQMINFGNPFREKRGDSIVPENFASQRPPLHVGENGTPMTPPGSPPHDTYDSPPIEDEGEAAFTGKRPASPPRSPRHSALKDLNLLLTRDGKRKKTDLQDDESKKPTEKSSSSPTHNEKVKQKVPPRPPPKSSTSQPPPPRPPPPNKGKQESRPSIPPPPPIPMPISLKRPSQSIAPKSRETSDLPSRKPPPPKKHDSGESPSGSYLPTSQIQPTKQNQTSANIVDIAKQLQIPDEKPKIDLPPGWMSVWSKSQKRWYFFDTRTNKSVWEWPPPGGAN